MNAVTNSSIFQVLYFKSHLNLRMRSIANLLLKNKVISIPNNSISIGSKTNLNWSQISRKSKIKHLIDKNLINRTFSSYSSSSQNNNNNNNGSTTKVGYSKQKSSKNIENFQQQQQSQQANIKPISIFSLNCFLVPNLFTLRKVNEGCRDQEPRAQDISRFIF